MSIIDNVYHHGLIVMHIPQAKGPEHSHYYNDGDNYTHNESQTLDHDPIRTELIWINNSKPEMNQFICKK